MTTIEIVAQCISAVAMVMNITAFQMRRQRGILLFQMFGSTLFAITLFMLGGYTGAMMNVVVVIRSLFYLNKDKFTPPPLLFFLCSLIVIITAYVLSFTVFGKSATAFNFFAELLPVIGTILSVIGALVKYAKLTRIMGLAGSPPWLAYSIINVNIGGMICDSFAIISVIIGLIRFDRNKKERSENN